jgi:hypothetical protein
VKSRIVGIEYAFRHLLIEAPSDVLGKAMTKNLSRVNRHRLLSGLNPFTVGKMREHLTSAGYQEVEQGVWEIEIPLPASTAAS